MQNELGAVELVERRRKFDERFALTRYTLGFIMPSKRGRHDVLTATQFFVARVTFHCSTFDSVLLLGLLQALTSARDGVQ